MFVDSTLGGNTTPDSVFALLMKATDIVLFTRGAALLLLSTTAPALAPANDTGSESTNIVLLVAYRFRGYHYLCGVTESKLVRAPRWESDHAEPPLSPRSALALAERHAWGLVSDSVRFKAQEVLLKNFAGGVWFYVVQLEPSNPRSPHTNGHMEPVKIAVLMDGTVAERTEQTKAQ